MLIPITRPRIIVNSIIPLSCIQCIQRRFTTGDSQKDSKKSKKSEKPKGKMNQCNS